MAVVFFFFPLVARSLFLKGMHRRNLKSVLAHGNQHFTDPHTQLRATLRMDASALSEKAKPSPIYLVNMT